MKRQNEPDWLDWCEPSLVRPLRKTDLVSLLRGLEGYELDDISFTLRIVGTRYGPEPAGIAEFMLKSALQHLQILDLTTLDLLARAAASPTPLPVDLESLQEKICALRSMGLLFSGTVHRQPVVVLPDEIRKGIALQINSEGRHQQATLNTQLLRACSRVLEYYGILAQADLYRIITQLGFQTDARQFDRLLNLVAAADFYASREDEQLWRHPTVDDADWLLEEHRARAALPFRPLNLELIQTPMISLPAFQDFRGLLQALGLANEDAEHLLGRYLYQVRNEHRDLAQRICDAVLMGLPADAEAPPGSILQHVERLRDQTPLWILKGHSPEDVRQLDIAVSTEALSSPFSESYAVDDRDDDDSDPDLDDLFDDSMFAEPSAEASAKALKIGRNEPCPCGSGKKYKKCCGKN